mmetsp:Transcript_81437/g.234040  ORF Transcript_81437/g.234040 Transcript_81437/m.234040 type:complete len:434 (-) Transcript_81437:2-1303(-)
MYLFATRRTAWRTTFSKEGLGSESSNHTLAKGNANFSYVSLICQSYGCSNGIDLGKTQSRNEVPLSSHVPSNLNEKFCLWGHISRVLSSPNLTANASSPRIRLATFLNRRYFELVSEEKEPKQVVFFSFKASRSVSALMTWTAGPRNLVTEDNKSASLYLDFNAIGSSSFAVYTRYSQLKSHFAPNFLANLRSSLASSTANATFFQFASFFPRCFASFAAFTKVSSCDLHCEHQGYLTLTTTAENFDRVLSRFFAVSPTSQSVLSSKYGASSSGSKAWSSRFQSLSNKPLNFLGSWTSTSHRCLFTLPRVIRTAVPHLSGRGATSNFMVSSTSSRRGKSKACSSPFAFLALKVRSPSAVHATDTEALSKSLTMTDKKMRSLVCPHLKRGVVGLPTTPGATSAATTQARAHANAVWHAMAGEAPEKGRAGRKPT